MNEMDKCILALLQAGLPLEEPPYPIVARQLGITPEQLLADIERLMAAGIIRRVGLSLDSRKLGYRSTLAAVRVPPAQVTHAAEVIGRFVEVTHSYLRDDAFNIWFTLIADNEQRIYDILEHIRQRLLLSPTDILNLPARQVFKLDARFSLPE